MALVKTRTVDYDEKKDEICFEMAEALFQAMLAYLVSVVVTGFVYALAICGVAKLHVKNNIPNLVIYFVGLVQCVFILMRSNIG